MDIFTIIIICLTALVVAGMAVGIANLARSIDRIETVQSKEIEAFTLSKKNLDGRIDEVIKSENAWHTHIENKLKTTDVEIDAITAKMAEIAKDCGRWDEIDTRIRIADAKAAEAQRLMILVFDLAQNIDIQRAGGIDKLIRTDKVTMKSVLKATGTDYSFLEKQIKNAAAVQERTASS